VGDATGSHRRIALDPGEGKPQVVLEAKDQLSQGLPTDKPLGADHAVAPIFYADDPEARVVGRLQGSNRAGLVVKRRDGWTGVYSAAMTLPPGLLRNLAREAGVHLWSETDEALYTDGRFLSLHASADGDKVLYLPRPCRVTDAITGQRVPTVGQRVRFHLKRAETRLLGLQAAGR
jgi:hypothetical protein